MTGERSGWRRLLEKELPRNVSWIHTLGALLGFYLVLQAVTGALLAFVYAPSVEDAHASVVYLRDELPLGRLVHGLHHHGAGLVLFVALLHMAKAYFVGAYHAPRRTLWWSGSAVLALLVAAVFTGILLPFDQEGYWASVVGLNLLADVPVVGGWLSGLLGGGGELDQVTLGRFHFLHVSLLPFLGLLLVGVHLAILQRVGSAPLPFERELGQGEGRGFPFFPRQTARDVVTCLLGALLLGFVALRVDEPPGPPASPADSSFVPVPEWYFLPHYGLLRALPSGWQGAGLAVPGLLAAFVLLVPLIDRGPRRRLRDRKGWGAVGLLVLGGLVGFGVAGARGAARERAERSVPEREGDPIERGRRVFERYDCLGCHVLGEEGERFGPDLTHVASRLRRGYVEPFLRDPQSFYPETEMPAFEGDEDELSDLVRYLESLD